MNSTVDKKLDKAKVSITLITGAKHSFEYAKKENTPDGDVLYYEHTLEELADPPVAIWDKQSKLFTIYTYGKDYYNELVINTNHVVSYHVITGQQEPNYLT